MATVMVSNLKGQAWVKDASGNIKAIENGMIILESDNVITGAGASLDLTSNSFDTISLSENRSVRLANNASQTSPNATDNAAQPISAEAQEILTALDAGDDIFANLEPTAAVIQGGGDAAGGSSFTRLLSIVETTNPLAIEYPRMGVTNPEDRITGLPTGGDVTPLGIAPLANIIFPVLSIGNVLVSEGDFANFKVSIENQAPVDTTITFTINPGTAGFDDLWADGEDRYVIVNGEEIPVNEDGTFDVNVPAGTTDINVGIPTYNDNVFEGEENFTLTGDLKGNIGGNDFTSEDTGTGIIVDADITATPDRNFVKEAGVGQINDDPNTPNPGKYVATGNVITGLVDGNINPDFTDNDGEDLDNLYLTKVTYNGETKGFGPDTTVTFDTDYGHLIINQDGSYEFTLDNDKPAVDELRPDSDPIDLEFDYTLSNGIATTDSTLTITIQGTNDRPAITSNEYGLNEETLIINGKLTATDPDAEEDELTWSIIGEENDDGSVKGNYGNITIDEKTGEWTYTRDENITVGSHAGKDKLVGSESDNKWIKESFDVTVTDEFGANDTQKINLVQSFLYENRTNSGFLRLNGNQKLALDLFGKENLTSDNVIILTNTSSQSLFVRKGFGHSVTEVKPGEDFVIQINQDANGNPILDFNDIRADAYWSGRVDGGFKLTLAEDNRSEDAKAQGSGPVENLDGLTSLDQALVDLHVYTSPLLNSADRGPEDASYDRYGSIWSMSSTKNYGEDRDFHLFKSGGNHMFYGGDLDGSLVAKAVTLHIPEGWTINDGTYSWTLGTEGEVPADAGFTVSFDEDSGVWLVHMKPNAEYSSTNQSQFPDSESLEYVDIFADDIRYDWTITPPAGSKETTEIKYEIDYAEWAYTYQIGSGNPEWGWLEANKVHTKTLEADPKSTKFDNSNVTMVGEDGSQVELKVLNNKVIAGNDGDKLTMTTGHNYNAANTAENGWIKLNVEGENGFDLSDRWQSMDSDETLYALLTPFKLESSSSTNTTNMSAKYAGEAGFRYMGDDGEYVYVSFNDVSATARRGFLVPKDKLDSLEFRGPDGHYGIFHIKVSAYVVDTNTWENGTVKTNIEVSGQSYLTNIKVEPRNDIQNLKVNAEVDNDFIVLGLENPNNLNSVSSDTNLVNLRIAANDIEGLIYDGQEIQSDNGYYYVNNFDASKELKVSVAENGTGDFIIEANTSGEYRTSIDNNGEPQDHSKSDEQPQRLELDKDNYETDWQEYGKVEFESTEGSIAITDVTNIVYAGAQGGEITGTAGNDVMHGGSGDDVFKFTADDASGDSPATDTIVAFGKEGSDMLDISALLDFDADGGLDEILSIDSDDDNNVVISVNDDSNNIKQTIVLEEVDYDEAIAKGIVDSLKADGKFHSDGN